jgi:hypothetical protein
MSSVGEGPQTEEVATIPAATNPGDLSPIFALVAVAALAWMGAVLLWSRKRG